ncbi:hypothetical protein CRG98_016234 [Punica granatum]|nr:hypothetical protein CRG98_016234 [Punica granatum]
MECLRWLDSKKAKSVIYANFGSIATVTPEELVEFAWGLANSKQDFLWVIRPDLVADESAVLPPEFGAETKDRGLVASWVPQEEVLEHSSVGGFLTHCGWNSILESISNGVPMLCWPFGADQPTNCRYCCTEWGIGMEIDGKVKRHEVEMMVRELMSGEKGGAMRDKATEWKSLAWEAVGPGGSSRVNFDRMIEEALLSPKSSKMSTMSRDDSV